MANEINLNILQGQNITLTLSNQVLSLGQLSDVDVSGITDGQLIQYQASTNTYIPSDAGTGDMIKAVYDPNLVEADAFAMDNMVESATSKVMTLTERDKLDNISVTQPVDLDTMESEQILNSAHRISDGTSHANVVLNDTHRLGDGSDHSEVALNITHRTSDGTDHSDVVLNNTHRADITTNPHSVTKTQVGLSNVDNTSDLNKPISTATQTALDLKTNDIDFTSHTGDLTIHFTENSIDHTNIQNIGVNTHIQIDSHIADVTTNPHSVTKTQVGLSDVDNTSDLNKPISTATQTELNSKLESVVGGTNVTIDNTDPINPIINATSSGFSDPMTTRGDIIYKNSSNVTTRLPLGSNGQSLTSDGTDVSWSTPSGGGDVSAGANLTDNSIIRGDGGAKGIQSSAITINDDGDIIPDVDDSQEIGSLTKTFSDGHFKTENGTYVSIRQLAGLQRDYSEEAAILPYTISQTIIGGVWTITITDISGAGYIAVVLNDKVIRSVGSTLSVDATSFAGTDLNPKTVYVYIQNNGSGVPILTASNISPEGVVIHSHVANYKVGSVATSSINIYAKIESSIQMYKIATNVSHRFFVEGAKYNTGLAITATTSDVTIGVGSYELIFEMITTAEKQVSIDGLYYIKNDGTYNESTDFSFGGEYSDGVSIDDGKSFNVVLGVLEDDTTRILALVQRGTVEQYGDFNKAYEDKKKQAVYQPSDELLRNLFVPVARIIVDRSGSTYSLEQFDTGLYYEDLRGTTGGGGSGSGSSNVTDGNNLNDSPYWNNVTGVYDPKTPTEARLILNVEDGAEANNISDADVTSLTSSADTTLHIHNSDRNRTNHSGTQLLETISDVTASATELNYVDGVTSNIQTQLNAKISFPEAPNDGNQYARLNEGWSIVSGSGSGINFIEVTNGLLLNYSLTPTTIGENSITLGGRSNVNNSASGIDAVAIGYDANALSYGCIAIGKNAKSDANGAVVIGENAHGGNGGVAIGYNTSTIDTGCIILGYNSNISGNYGTSVGYACNISSINSTTIGNHLECDQDKQVVLGTYNDTTNSNIGFMVGNGASGALSNLFEVLNDGTVNATAFIGDGSGLTGVPSDVQTQLNAKLDKSGGTMTGDINLGNNDLLAVKTIIANSEVVESFATTKTIDFSTGSKRVITLTGNINLTISVGGISNANLLRVIQDSTGSRVITFANLKTGLTAPEILTGPNEETLLAIYKDGDGDYWVQSLKLE